MTRRGTIIRAVLALLIAYFAQRLWMSELNFTVWKITYIGEQIAFVIARPNYDGAMSVGIFQSLAIIINAFTYFVVLWAFYTLRVQWKLKRALRRTATES